MKEIAVIANQRSYAQYLKDNLDQYFKEYANIHAYSLKDIAKMDFISEEYVVVSAFTIFEDVKPKVKNTSTLLIASLSLNREGLALLDQVPRGEKVLLVNIDYRTCMQVITSLYDAGYRDLDLVPYYGQKNYDPEIRAAITADEMHMVPPGMDQVINIGQRVVDLNCVLDLTNKLGLEKIPDSPEAVAAKSHIYGGGTSMERLLGENESLGERINVLIKLMEQGIIIADVTGRIYAGNKKAAKLMKKRSETLIGLNVTEILSELDVLGDWVSTEDVNEKIIEISGNTLVAGVNRILIGDEIRGSVITLESFKEIEEKQHGIRAKLNEENHVAKYRFADIQGESRAIREAVQTARRMARSDSSILITGESGTGKEVFAQSIHNASSRSRYNFVAVNCAAIPEHLLESEMFGYEEGSFTGAKKGGKVGYFELAHNGTIFLDEIAELPLPLQSKLLRVIEEKKINKIGSQKLIDINVRIISATNKNLYQLVERGEFREDLYYRLNVLPLALPPLRDREGDVELMIRSFKNKMESEFVLSAETLELLKRYEWRGNLRELRNVVEYLTSLDKIRIEPEDLPFAGSLGMFAGSGENRGLRDAQASQAFQDSRTSQASQAFQAFQASRTSQVSQVSRTSRAAQNNWENWAEPGEASRSQGRDSQASDWQASDDRTLDRQPPDDRTPDRQSVDRQNLDRSLCRQFVLREGRRLDFYGFLLAELMSAYEEKRRVGRAALCAAAEEQGLFYSEPEIRGALRRLDEYGFIRSARGRSGSTITEAGRVLWEEIRRELRLEGAE